MRRGSEPRERTEELERASLSTWATLAAETKGRDRHEDPHPYATQFQVDRDRIVSSAAFHRLAGKTHLFVPSLHGGWRTRLAHTLDVARVARAIARALRLNEDLTEGIALGHDLGQPAFGPAGEAALSLFPGTTFDHAAQGMRVVESLEARGAGLNLTWEVRDGIWHHRHPGPEPATAEGQVVRLAGRIAVASDVAAALAAGLVRRDDLPSAVRGAPRSWLDDLVGAAVAGTSNSPQISLTPAGAGLLHALEETAAMLDEHPSLRAERDRAVHCLQALGIYYSENEAALPPGPPDTIPRRVLDLLSGWTDEEARRQHNRVFLPGQPECSDAPR